MTAPRVSVDAGAFAVVRDMFSGGWCTRRRGEPCGEPDCGQCDFDAQVDELIATARPLPPALSDADAEALANTLFAAARAVGGAEELAAAAVAKGLDVGPFWVAADRRWSEADTVRVAVIAALTGREGGES